MRSLSGLPTLPDFLGDSKFRGLSQGLPTKEMILPGYSRQQHYELIQSRFMHITTT